jgi:hypothetical protein
MTTSRSKKRTADADVSVDVTADESMTSTMSKNQKKKLAKKMKATDGSAVEAVVAAAAPVAKKAAVVVAPVVAAAAKKEAVVAPVEKKAGKVRPPPVSHLPLIVIVTDIEIFTIPSLPLLPSLEVSSFTMPRREKERLLNQERRCRCDTLESSTTERSLIRIPRARLCRSH